MDFYIPGYVGQPEFDEKTGAHIGNKNYKFYRNEYNSFCFQFSEDFGIDFPYVATLVMIEYKPNCEYSHLKKCIFNLENLNGGIRSASQFFNILFNAAKKKSTLQEILNLTFKEVENGPYEIGFSVINKILATFNLDLEDPVNKYMDYKHTKDKYKLK